MRSTFSGGLGLNILYSEGDLESAAGANRLGTTLARIKRFVFRRRCLLFGTYTLLFVVLGMGGLRYIDRREIYGIQLPSLPSLHDHVTTTFDTTRLLPHHPQYIVFDPLHFAKPPSERPLPPSPIFPRHCLESHIALGYPCFMNETSTFDIIWTWVNGSDPRLQDAMAESAVKLQSQVVEAVEEPKKADPKGGTSKPTSKLYRDHDELRHSLRSVLQHFREHTRQFHLLTSDFPYPEDEYAHLRAAAKDSVSTTTNNAIGSDFEQGDKGNSVSPDPALVLNNRTLRLGQLPSWLSTADEGRWKDGNIEIKVLHHAQVFQNYTGTVFNSYAIESQFPFMPDVTHNFIYLNDDFFFTGDLMPSDFYTSAYGVVLRLDPTLLVNPVPANSKVNPVGEWGPLGYSSWLLSERFGTRGRPYPIHAAKSFSMPLLQEAARIWEDEFSATAEHKFRGMKEPETGSGDAHMTFLLTHFVVERWREALLWSWVVGRIGGDEDQWGLEQKQVAWEELGGNPEDIDNQVVVNMTPRKTLEADRVARTLEASGQTFSKRTAYSFSSSDGYPYSYVDRQGKMMWPQFSGASIGQSLCRLDFNLCIGTASSASEAFKHIAFEKPVACGDCIIAALRSSSGVLGLSAFLPPRQRSFKPSYPSSLWDQLLHFDIWGGADEETVEHTTAQGSPPVAHLPPVKSWAQGNFSLQAVLDPYGKVNVRAWTLRLLERYRFVLGDSNVLFFIIKGPNGLVKSLKTVTHDVSLLCMNDDVRSRHELADKIFRNWEKSRWSKPAEWER